ncbi:chemotaxis protein CheW [Methylomonas koyamae]|uniref:Chemotaxis protein CheW n=1 Tax=Methylomonas koyamae TaxID=702114 RepID=A0A291IF46_9GAMM|nr:chemotaxis protein CheW [Methylomonas koyamae]ATG88836.1 chemotaxis protein CheW [Methylomonas koyamae]OAI28033.1 chemotaxis protein CheW [Methylomonas koyamae]
MKQKSPPGIVKQQLALDAYLQTLLDDVPDADASVEAKAPSSPEAKPVTLVARQPAPIVAEASPPVLQAEPKARKARISSPDTVLAAAENPTKLQALSVMPDWSQYEFQALFFKVDQLILATPLVELSRTIKMDRKPSQIPGQPSWFLGLVDEHDSRIGVLDTSQLIFGKSRVRQGKFEDSPAARILITQDKRWGLVCDEILSIGKIKPDGVRWRTARQKKPWLIGTVIDELTAIVDVKQLVPHRK